MNITTISTASQSAVDSLSSNGSKQQTTYKIEMLDDSMASDDDDDDLISSDGSMFDESDLAQIGMQDDLANQLAAAGPVGVAAAAAIASSKKRKRQHSFETNPSVRKRQQNRLLRKLRGIIYEFTGRVGKQAVVLVATPGKPNTSYKVFGAKPLEDVVRNLKNIVMDELENALAQQAPPPPQEDPSLFELPPLIIDGIPTPVEKMTQAQLRAFIPLMLKYSTGRGKPGWGREATRPPWWPKELPWANVRMDARSEDDKQKSWTHALRKIVINCYKYHGREDLLPTFADEDEKVAQLISQDEDDDDGEDEDDEVIVQPVSHHSSGTTIHTSNNATSNQQVNVVKINSSGTVITTTNPHNPSNPGPTIIQSTNDQHITTTARLPASTKIELCPAPIAQLATTHQQQQQQQQQQQSQQNQTQQIHTTNSVSASTAAQTIANAQVCIEPMTLGDVDYSTQTVLSTIQNPDGTVSLIQVDPNNPIITLPDGTTAQVQGVATLHQGEGGATIQTVQSLADVNSHDNMTVDLTEATVAQDGQIYITAEDGQGYPVSVSNMITVPVTASMYQSMMANIQQIHTNSDGTVCITPMQVDAPSNSSSSSNSDNNNNNNHSNSNNNNNNSNNINSNNSLVLRASSGRTGGQAIASSGNSEGSGGAVVPQQYQCYSIMAAAPLAGSAATVAQRLLATNNLGQPQNFMQNLNLSNINANSAIGSNSNTNHINNNTNQNNAHQSDNSRSNASSTNTNHNNIRCQIVNPSSLVSTNSSHLNNGSGPQQHQLVLPGHALLNAQSLTNVLQHKVFLAASPAQLGLAGILNSPNNSSGNNNNNTMISVNNNNNSNNNILMHGNSNSNGHIKIATAAMPIVLTTAAPPPLVAANDGHSARGKHQRQRNSNSRTGNKRRKNDAIAAKVAAIKREADVVVAADTSSAIGEVVATADASGTDGQGLLNLEILNTTADGTLDENCSSRICNLRLDNRLLSVDVSASIPASAVKLEALDN